REVGPNGIGVATYGGQGGANIPVASGSLAGLLPVGAYSLTAGISETVVGIDLTQGNDSYSSGPSVNFTMDVKPNEWKGGGHWGSGSDGVWTGADPGNNTLGTLNAKFRTATPGGVAGIVTLDQDRTVNKLIFSNTNSYTIRGSNTL